MQRTKFFLIALVLATAPSSALAALAPGETLNPNCGPTDPGCIVLTTATNTAGVFVGTSTTATSTLPNLQVTNINILGTVFGNSTFANSSSTNGTTTNATTTTLSVGSFLNALLAYIDQLTARVATLYTATVGSLTATSTASLFGGTQTSNLTATGTTHLATTYASTLYASTTNASTTNANILNIANGAFTASSSGITATNANFTSATATNLFVSGTLTTSNPAIFNATSSFSTTTSASSTITTANITNLYAAGATTTNLNVTNGITSGSTTVSGTVTAGSLQAGSSTITGTTTTGGVFASFANILSAVIASLTSYTGTFGTLNATSSASLASTTLSGNTLLSNAMATNLYVSGSLTSLSPASFSATSSFSTTTSASSSITNANVTNLFVANATTTNLNVTNGITAGSTTVAGTGTFGALVSGSSTVSGTTTTGGIFSSFANLLSAVIASLTSYTGTFGILTATTSSSLASSTLQGSAIAGSLIATSSASLASTTLSGNTLIGNATATNLFVSGTLTTGNPATFNATSSFSTTTSASSSITNANISNLYATAALLGSTTVTGTGTFGALYSGSSTVSGTTTTGGLFASFLNSMTGYFQNLFASTASIGSVTAGSLTATGTTNLSTTYASTIYASTTYATTSNASTTNTTMLNVANGAVTASSTGLTATNFNAANITATLSTTSYLGVTTNAQLQQLQLLGTATTTFNGALSSQSGNFTIAGATGNDSVLLVPYGGSVGIGGSALGKFGIQQGTLTSSENALNISGTWNSAGTTFTGLFVNFTDTASAAGSYLANWQVNGSPVFRISKTGTTTIAGGLIAGATSTFSNIDMNSTRIANLLTPTFGNDAATKSYVDALIQGLSWQAPVNSLATTTIAASTTGDRYIIYSAGGINFTSCAVGDIAENTGIGAWTCTTAATGTTVFVDSFINESYTYNGSAWNSLGSAISHNSLTGLQGGTANEYYHVTATDYASLTGVGAQLAQLKDTGSPTFVGLTTSGTIKAADGSARCVTQSSSKMRSQQLPDENPTVAQILRRNPAVHRLAYGAFLQDHFWVDEATFVTPLKPMFSRR